ncbi:hypothetical protein NEAUS05_1674 [Nematocida ausubeli]|nr:hypothetical protein NEAUS05_1674 [Nematocida ausubeli]
MYIFFLRLNSMQFSITQLVISRPPCIKCPSVHIMVDGMERSYTPESMLPTGKKAFIEVDEFWLIYTDGFMIDIGHNTLISIISNNITVGSITLAKLPLGIGRYYKKDFKIQRHLPDDIFLDIIVESLSNTHITTSERIPSITETLNQIPSYTSVKKAPALSNFADSPAPFKPDFVPMVEASSTNLLANNLDNLHTQTPNIVQSKEPGLKETPLPIVKATQAISSMKIPSPASTEQPANSTAKIFSKMPSPPGMRVRPTVDLLEGADVGIKTLFPKVGWKPVLSVKGSLYESPMLSESGLLDRWTEIEDDFKKKFCIKRGIQQTGFLKRDRPGKKERILSERQEFLLSIVFEAIKKSKVSLKDICNELIRWTETEEHAPHIDSLVNLSLVFPLESESIKIMEATHVLTEVESKVKLFLQNNCTKGRLTLIKYVHWAHSSLVALIATLQEIRSSLISVENDKEFPAFLVILLRLGNLVNYKYAEVANKSPAKGFYLSSVSAFSKCAAEIINEEGCRLSLLEFIILTTRDKIDFKKILSTYAVFKNIHLKSLKDHYSMLRAGYDEVVLLDDFTGKKERLHKIFLIIRECEYLISEVDTKLFVLSKVHADTPEYISENMVDAIGSIEKYSYLFR